MVLLGSGRKSGIFKFVSVLLFLLFLVGCGERSKNTYFKGDRALSRGEFQKAYKTFEQVVAIDEGSPWAAMAFLKLAQMERTVYHRPQKALEYCQSLVQGDYPEEFRRKAFLIMAQIQAEDLNHPLEGLKILEGMEGAQEDRERQRFMVEYAIRGGDLEKAARLARVFLEKGEGGEGLPFALVLADLFKSAGDFKDAEELYNKVRTRARGDLACEAIMGLAGLREDQGRLKDALNLLKRLKEDGYKTSLVDVKMRHIRRRLREERG